MSPLVLNNAKVASNIARALSLLQAPSVLLQETHEMPPYVYGLDVNQQVPCQTFSISKQKVHRRRNDILVIGGAGNVLLIYI